MKTLVHCFIISRIDYCNSLLYGIKLHWLPVRWRIKYKIALITYKTLKGDGPEYLRELLEISQKSLRSDKHLKPTVPKSKLKNGGDRSSLRSDKHLKPTVPKSKLINGGDRSFSVCAPIVWNSLSTEIKDQPLTSFKKDLKTVLFKKSIQT